MRRIITLFSLLITFFLIFHSCSDTLTGPDGAKGELPRELTATEKKIIEADQKFSYELFQRGISRAPGENLLISPLSVSMALSMVLNGAEGDTYEAMLEALKFEGLTLDEINEGYKSITELLVNLDPDVKFTVANSIWFREGLPVKETFLDQVRDAFGATAESHDFSLKETVDIINQWVSIHTEGMIDSIIDEIAENEVMFLINALYFKGDWLSQFDINDTEKADFYLEDGSKKSVDLMSQSGRFASYFSDTVHMVELPYGDSLFSMTVLLPANSSTPIDEFIENNISNKTLLNWRSKLSDGTQEIVVQLPRFEIEYEESLNDLLKEMGMEIAFDEWHADFTGIADISPDNIAIGDVKHKTVIRVDEEGSEAAAVTNVGMIATSMPPVLRADRPFVFIIHERESGTNLFMGKMVNP